jgi:hypothetical protein
MENQEATKRHGWLMTAVAMVGVMLVATGCCWRAWEMDYGKPVQQFHSVDVMAYSAPYLGKKITVKGIVQQLQVDDQLRVTLVLDHQVCCDLGIQDHAGVDYYKKHTNVGDTLFMDGFLKTIDKERAYLSPAMGRENSAPFAPFVPPNTQ